jgi:hypothetical protein
MVFKENETVAAYSSQAVSTYRKEMPPPSRKLTCAKAQEVFRNSGVRVFRKTTMTNASPEYPIPEYLNT